MAKAPNSVVGLDLGRSSLKAVLLQRSGADRLSVTHFATLPTPTDLQSPEQLATDLRSLLKSMGGSAKACAVAVSSPDSIIRIIDQPETPTNLLRDALRLNGMTLLNQDCRQFVLDCDRIPVSAPETLESGKQRYLVGGLPRPQVDTVQKAVQSAFGNFTTFQVGPVSLFNAFESANPEAFGKGGFLLVDIGATSSTIILGAKRELVLVRSVDIGGATILDALEALSGEPRESVIIALQQEDEMMIENGRVAMMNLSREIANSIGFFEGRREERIAKIHVSGAAAKSHALLRILKDEVHIPCEGWNPLAGCDISVAANRRQMLADAAFDLHVAYGAAAELIKS
jgi:type IV pilus assembly protein PilM